MLDKSKPLILKYRNSGRYLSLKLQTSDLPALINSIKSQWGNFNKEIPFEYFFLDQSFNAQYKSEERLVKVIGVFTIFAIMISCFGLLGLVSYVATQKQKEIGIRKVNGAGIWNIVWAIIGKFMIWVSVAFVLAIPISYIIMEEVLMKYSYRISIEFIDYLIALFIVVLVTISTCIYQAYKAATSNPVNALQVD